MDKQINKQNGFLASYYFERKVLYHVNCINSSIDTT